MTKKEFMLEVINFLPDWKMGWGLKPLIENNMLSPEAFQKLYLIFEENVKSGSLEIEKFKLKERLETVEAMRQADDAQRQNELLNLESVFDNL